MPISAPDTGSVSQQVLYHASCPVLVVRNPVDDSGA
ncbi:universal stress protein [Catellatospora coxensis]